MSSLVSDKVSILEEFGLPGFHVFIRIVGLFAVVVAFIGTVVHGSVKVVRSVGIVGQDFVVIGMKLLPCLCLY